MTSLKPSVLLFAQALSVLTLSSSVVFAQSLTSEKQWQQDLSIFLSQESSNDILEKLKDIHDFEMPGGDVGVNSSLHSAQTLSDRLESESLLAQFDAHDNHGVLEQIADAWLTFETTLNGTIDFSDTQVEGWFTKRQGQVDVAATGVNLVAMSVSAMAIGMHGLGGTLSNHGTILNDTRTQGKLTATIDFDATGYMVPASEEEVAYYSGVEDPHLNYDYGVVIRQSLSHRLFNVGMTLRPLEGVNNVLANYGSIILKGEMTGNESTNTEKNTTDILYEQTNDNGHFSVTANKHEQIELNHELDQYFMAGMMVSATSDPFEPLLPTTEVPPRLPAKAIKILNTGTIVVDAKLNPDMFSFTPMNKEVITVGILALAKQSETIELENYGLIKATGPGISHGIFAVADKGGRINIKTLCVSASDFRLTGAQSAVGVKVSPGGLVDWRNSSLIVYPTKEAMDESLSTSSLFSFYSSDVNPDESIRQSTKANQMPGFSKIFSPDAMFVGKLSGEGLSNQTVSMSVDTEKMHGNTFAFKTLTSNTERLMRIRSFAQASLFDAQEGWQGLAKTYALKGHY